MTGKELLHLTSLGGTVGCVILTLLWPARFKVQSMLQDARRAGEGHMGEAGYWDSGG